MLNETDLVKLEKEYDKIKVVMGNKLAEMRVLAGFPKRTYPNSMKSANLLFTHESGQSFPNEDTLRYYLDLYQVSEKNSKVLFDLHKYGKQIKSRIIKIKRGWN